MIPPIRGCSWAIPPVQFIQCLTSKSKVNTNSVPTQARSLIQYLAGISRLMAKKSGGSSHDLCSLNLYGCVERIRQFPRTIQR